MSAAVAVAPAPTTPKVKKTIVKKVSVHPPYASMVKQSIAALADKKVLYPSPLPSSYSLHSGLLSCCHSQVHLWSLQSGRQCHPDQFSYSFSAQEGSGCWSTQSGTVFHSINQYLSTVFSLTVIIQVKGNGASGSFRLGEKKTAEKKKATKSVKKPVAKKSTTASPKKTKKTSKVR